MTKLERSNRAHQRLQSAANTRVGMGLGRWNDNMLGRYHQSVIDEQRYQKRVLSKPERQKIFKEIDSEAVYLDPIYAEIRASASKKKNKN